MAFNQRIEFCLDLHNHSVGGPASARWNSLWFMTNFNNQYVYCIAVYGFLIVFFFVVPVIFKNLFFSLTNYVNFPESH